MTHICIVVGARPNFMKIAPIVHAVEKRNQSGAEVAYTVVYTGKADDPTLEPSLFDDLEIARPKVYLGVEESNLNALTGQVMNRFEHYLRSHPTDVVIVVDDLASTMAAAIVTKKEGVRLAHLVAGTRSFDINMPKEINRLVIDGLSDYLFTAGDDANNIVFREGVKENKVYTVGNILIDTLRRNRPRQKKPVIMGSDGTNIVGGDYLVFTLNRKKLIHDSATLQPLVEALVEGSGGIPVIAPLRQEAKQAVEAILHEKNHTLHIIPPLSYPEFGYLTSHALGIVTDSGNIAEEATFNHVPCATLNTYAEHQETVSVGTNCLVGEDAAVLRQCVAQMTQRQWKTSHLPDRWDGRTAERIVEILCRE